MIRTKSEMVQLTRRIIADTETKIVEYKEARRKFGFDDLDRYFSALSNEANLRNSECGCLFFGVTDDGGVCGTSYRQEEGERSIGLQNVFDIQRSRLLPMPTYKLSEPNRVAVAFYGGVLNEAYSRLLAAEPLLEPNAVLLPDMVQKEQPISKEQAHMADELSRRK